MSKSHSQLLTLRSHLASSTTSDLQHLIPSLFEQKEENKESPAVPSELEHLLQDPICLSYFRSFLQLEHSEENILFWIQTQKFPKIEDPSDRRSTAKKLFKDFIVTGAPYQVNVSHPTRENLNKLINDESQDLPPTLFERGEKEIFTLMRTDSVDRFFKSPLFERLQKRISKHSFLEYERPPDLDLPLLFRRNIDENGRKLSITKRVLERTRSPKYFNSLISHKDWTKEILRF